MAKDQSTPGPSVLGWSAGSTAKGLVWLVRPGRLHGLGRQANTTTRIVHFSHPREPSLESGFPRNRLLMNSYFCVRTLLKFLIFPCDAFSLNLQNHVVGLHHVHSIYIS